MGADLGVIPAPAVLYVTRSQAAAQGVERALQEAKLPFMAVADREQAIRALGRQPFALCLIDLADSGIALRTGRAIMSEAPGATVIGVAHPDRPELTLEALRAGFQDVVTRPLTGRDLELIVATAVERASVRGEGEAEPGGVVSPDLIGQSPPLRRLLEVIRRTANAQCSVLILAEPGLDAEAVARVIHGRSRRAAEPFVLVGCAAAEPWRVERELFGRPAARSAAALEEVTPDCRVVSARAGTLFLTDVSELPAAAQARLARLARDGEMRLAGTERTVPFRARLMAASVPGFETEVERGHFRPDLYRRLGLMRIELPPLRQRAEDVPLLAKHLAGELCTALGLPPKTFTNGALTLLAALPWRGNTGELRTLIENLITHVQNGVIQLEDVLTSVRLDGGQAAFVPNGSLREARVRFEREYIAAVLQHHRWRMSDAAKTLGIQRTNLYRKARQLNIPRAKANS